MELAEFEFQMPEEQPDMKKNPSIVASEVFLRLAAFNCSKKLQVEFLLMFVKTIDSKLLHENL